MRFKTAELELRWIDADGINCGIEVEFKDNRIARRALRELFEIEENAIWIEGLGMQKLPKGAPNNAE